MRGLPRRRRYIIEQHRAPLGHYKGPESEVKEVKAVLRLRRASLTHFPLLMTTYPARIPASAFAPRRVHPVKDKLPPPAPQPPLRPSAFSGKATRANSNGTVSIPRLREAIHSLDSKMASLMSQRHELESHLEQAVRSQSPVLRLPSELFSKIFVMGVLGMGDENPVMVATLMLVWFVSFHV